MEPEKEYLAQRRKGAKFRKNISCFASLASWRDKFSWTHFFSTFAKKEYNTALVGPAQDRNISQRAKKARAAAMKSGSPSPI
jgi:hypothetical protein